MESNLGLFLLSIVGISLTGVMLPGPMTAATIAKGYGNRDAGALIAVGHGVVEVPLIVAIYFGFGQLVNSAHVVTGIYIAGGLMLLYLAFRMLRTIGGTPGEVAGLPSSSVVTGIVLTGGNAAFYVWWATVGVALVAGAARFGVTGLVLFTVVHWVCDLGWSEFLSASTFKSRRWWNRRVQKAVFTVCGLILGGFGVWFCVSAVL